jgi:hypothetical protein
VIQPAVNFDNPPAGGVAWFVAKDASQTSLSYQPGKIRFAGLTWNAQGHPELLANSWDAGQALGVLSRDR